MVLTDRSRRATLAVAATCVVAAAAFAVVIVRSAGETPTVETQGTLHPAPATGPSPGSEPPRVSGTVATTVAPVATSEPDTTSPIAPTTPAAAPRPAPPNPAPEPVVPDEVRPDQPAPGTDPFHLSIDRIGVDAPILAVGVEPGTNAMEIPGLDDVGWYRYGSMPGDPTGTAVLVGHVDGDGRPGVFSALRDLAPGDGLTVVLPDGTPRGFAVTGVEQFDKQALPTDLFTRGGPARLALITCGGAFDAATGHYVDNVVVVAAAT